MSDCDCDCDCDCFGNSDGCCCDDAGGGPENSTTYGAISTGDVVADCLDTAIDIGTDAYEPIPSNTSKKSLKILMQKQIQKHVQIHVNGPPLRPYYSQFYP